MEISACSTWVKFKKQNQMQHRLVLFRTIVALLTLVTLFTKPIHIPLKCKHMQSKKFGCYYAKSKQFHQNFFIPVTQAGVFILENFLLGYKILGGNTDISVARPVWLLICTQINFYEGKIF